MEVEASNAERHLERLPQDLVVSLRERMESAKQSFEDALSEWAIARARYWELKKAAWANSEGAKHWKEKLHTYESRLEEARLQWRSALQSLQKSPALY